MSVYCMNCGLSQVSDNLSGCTQDTVKAHEWVNTDDHDYGPFRDWSVDDLVARMERAETKALSAAMTADHFLTCPTSGGEDSFVYRLYEEKRIKRLNLRNHLLAELVLRVKAAERLFKLG